MYDRSRPATLIAMAIKSFRDERCARLLRRESPGRRFPPALIKATYLRLLALERAATLDQLRTPPGNKLEALKGDRAGQHSIRVNDQFCICFRRTESGPMDVEFVDYH